MTNAKITSRRELAVRLSKGGVSLNLLSLRLKRTVDMWLSRNEVKIETGMLELTS